MESRIVPIAIAGVVVAIAVALYVGWPSGTPVDVGGFHIEVEKRRGGGLAGKGGGLDAIGP